MARGKKKPGMRTAVSLPPEHFVLEQVWSALVVQELGTFR